MIKYIIIGCLLLIFFFANSLVIAKKQQMVNHNSLNETINKIRPCIVQISASVKGIKNISGQTPFISWIAGTGFLINEESYVVTNAHVIVEVMKDFEKYQAEKKDIFVGFAIPDYHDSNNSRVQGNYVLTIFDIIAIDETNDIAILKTLSNPFKEEMKSRIIIGGKEVPAVKVSPCKFYKGIPSEGMNIAVSGYPLNIPTLITQNGIVSSTIYPFEFKNFILVDSFWMDARVNHGNSGGPVYLAETGEVATAYRLAPTEVKDKAGNIVATYELLQNSGLTKVVPIKNVIELLKKNNIAWH